MAHDSGGCLSCRKSDAGEDRLANKEVLELEEYALKHKDELPHIKLKDAGEVKDQLELVSELRKVNLENAKLKQALEDQKVNASNKKSDWEFQIEINKSKQSEIDKLRADLEQEKLVANKLQDVVNEMFDEIIKLRADLATCVSALAKAQEILMASGMLTNSSEIFKPALEVWNVNASVLAKVGK